MLSNGAGYSKVPRHPIFDEKAAECADKAQQSTDPVAAVGKANDAGARVSFFTLESLTIAQRHVSQCPPRLQLTVGRANPS